jgi:hypothetical protein
MKKVIDVQRYCRHHFGLVSFGPFEAIESKLNVAACRDASMIRGKFSEFVTFFRVRTLRTRMPQQLA